MHNLKIWISHSDVLRHVEHSDLAHSYRLFSFSLSLPTHTQSSFFSCPAGFLFRVYLCVCHQKSQMCISHRLHTTFSISFTWYTTLNCTITLLSATTARHRRKKWTNQETEEERGKQNETDSLQKRNAHMPISVSVFRFNINYRWTFSLAIKSQSQIQSSHHTNSELTLKLAFESIERTIVRYDNFGGPTAYSLCQFVEVEMAFLLSLLSLSHSVVDFFTPNDRNAAL